MKHYVIFILKGATRIKHFLLAFTGWNFKVSNQLLSHFKRVRVSMATTESVKKIRKAGLWFLTKL